MARAVRHTRPKDLDQSIILKLNEALILANTYFQTGQTETPPYALNALNPGFIEALDLMAKYCEKASGGYSNLLTSLSIKAVMGEAVDIRYHQVQIQNLTSRPAGFNFRGVSETVIYNWMIEHEFSCAKSGWQTRTFERPKPYMLDYDENIGTIKQPFLTCYDQVETYNQDATLALAFLLWRRIQLREASNITLAIPRLQDVLQITSLLSTHFFYKYNDSKGASRLPVLAIYAIYSILLNELSRYNGKSLKALESHSSADSQTGAIGDIEVLNSDGTIFEAVEVKHELAITRTIVESVMQKIKGYQVDRYYILTTYNQHDPESDALEAIEKVKSLLGCQLIANGVIPSIKYYLRLLSNPGAILPVYVECLKEDTALGFEHRDVWNKLNTGEVPVIYYSNK